MPLQVVAHITSRPEKINDTKAMLEGLIGPTRQETGCISYHFFQNNADPTDFAFVEQWASDEALDAHLETPHIQGAIARVAELLSAPPDIRRYTLVA